MRMRLFFKISVVAVSSLAASNVSVAQQTWPAARQIPANSSTSELIMKYMHRGPSGRGPNNLLTGRCSADAPCCCQVGSQATCMDSEADCKQIFGDAARCVQQHIQC